MPKVEAFADDSCLQDISLPSFSDSSIVFSDTSHNQSLTFATESGPNSPRQPPPPRSPEAADDAASGTLAEQAAYLIRVPPGFEQRFGQEQTVAEASLPAAAEPPRPSVGLHYEALAVRVPREYDQHPTEFMAPAMQVIPLQVGRFVGDNQRDMDEMVRILRGASDWIDPTYIYVIDPLVRQFIWESLGTTVMNLFPDIQFMRQQLFMHLIHLHMGNAAVSCSESQNAGAKHQQQPMQQQPQIPVNSADGCQLAGSVRIDRESRQPTQPAATIGIDRGCMNKCRQIDPYLALIQLAIYSDPAQQPPPKAMHRAAEDFALFGTMYTAPAENGIDQPAPSSSTSGESNPSTILEKCEMLLQFSGYPGGNKLQPVAPAHFPLPYAQPIGQYQYQPNRPTMNQSPHSITQSQSPTNLGFADGAMVPKLATQFEYSAFVPLNKSSPLRRGCYIEQLHQQQQLQVPLPFQYNNAMEMATCSLQNALLQQQQQQQHGLNQSARANLYTQFRLAKRQQQQGVQYSLQSVTNCGEISRVLHNYQQQQPTHFQHMQQQQLHPNQLMHFRHGCSVSDYPDGAGGGAAQSTNCGNNNPLGEKSSVEPESGDLQATDD